MTADIQKPFDDLPPTQRLTVFGVEYAHLKAQTGGDLYVTRFGWPAVDCLLPQQWYDDRYYSNVGERMKGSTGTVYFLRTCPLEGHCIDVIIKFSRMAQHVPLMADESLPPDVDRAEVASAIFNSPFEEFGLLQEMRNRPIPEGRKVMYTKRPLAIYVPAKRFPMWQMGRSNSRFHVHEHLLEKDQADCDRPLRYDIRRDYIMLFGWVDGLDAQQAAEKGLLTDEELEQLTARATEDMRSRGFAVLDNKPKHYIVRQRRNGELMRDKDGDLIYALIDFELLQRTPEYRQQVLQDKQAAKWASVPARRV